MLFAYDILFWWAEILLYLCRVISQFTNMEKPDKILAAALKLFVAYGFHGTPTSKIAVEAGVSNGTLFHYFKTKDELVVSLYTSIKEELNAYLSNKIGEGVSFKEKFRRLFIHSQEWATAHKDAYYFIQQFHFSPHRDLVPAEVVLKQSRMHTEMLQAGVQACIFKPLPVDMIATMAASQINGIREYLMRSNLPTAKQEKVINDAFELLWSMLANPEKQ